MKCLWDLRFQCFKLLVPESATLASHLLKTFCFSNQRLCTLLQAYAIMIVLMLCDLAHPAFRTSNDDFYYLIYKAKFDLFSFKFCTFEHLNLMWCDKYLSLVFCQINFETVTCWFIFYES